MKAAQVRSLRGPRLSMQDIGGRGGDRDISDRVTPRDEGIETISRPSAGSPALYARAIARRNGCDLIGRYVLADRGTKTALRHNLRGTERVVAASHAALRDR